MVRETDEWNVVETILSSVLDEEDAEKLVYALKESVKYEVEQILNEVTQENKI
jgi:hypothetical protein